jgi:cation transport regulator ChaB
MPFTASTIPDSVKKATSDPKRRRQFADAWNSAYKAAKADGMSDSDAEARAFQVAWAAIKKADVKPKGSKADNALEDMMAGASAVFSGLVAHLKGKTKREAGFDFPAAAYAYVPDADNPSTWKLRLWASPTEKETSRQVGMAVAALGPAGFRGNKVEIPTADLAKVKAKVKAAWRRVHKGDDTAKVPAHLQAAFSADPEATELQLPTWANFADVPEDDPDAEYILRTGPIMRTGDYSDKGLGLVTVDDLAANAENFVPGPMDLQHLSDKVQTVLDGKLGALVALHHDATTDPDTLYGTVMVPRWLDNLQASPEERQVSTTWDIPSRRIEKMAWVVEPRVPGARLEEAYATFAASQGDGELAKRHDTYSGQRVLQRVHDVAAESGAVCKRPSGNADMASSHEASAVQHIHDHAVEHGAKCDGQAMRPGQAVMPYGMFSMAPPNAGGEPAHQEGADAMPRNFAKFMAWLAADGDDDEPAGSQPASSEPQGQPAAQGGGTATSASPQQGEQPAADPPKAENSNSRTDDPVRAEMERIATENRRMRLEKVQGEAVAFVERATEKGAIFPVEKKRLADLYEQLAMDDQSHGGLIAHLASGPTEGGVHTRLDLLKAWLEDAPPHQLTREMLAEPAQRFFTMVNPQGTTNLQADDREPTKEKVDELIAKTHKGQALLNARDGVSRPAH